LCAHLPACACMRSPRTRWTASRAGVQAPFAPPNVDQNTRRCLPFAGGEADEGGSQEGRAWFAAAQENPRSPLAQSCIDAWHSDQVLPRMKPLLPQPAFRSASQLQLPDGRLQAPPSPNSCFSAHRSSMNASTQALLDTSLLTAGASTGTNLLTAGASAGTNLLTAGASECRRGRVQAVHMEVLRGGGWVGLGLTRASVSSPRHARTHTYTRTHTHARLPACVQLCA